MSQSRNVCVAHEEAVYWVSICTVCCPEIDFYGHGKQTTINQKEGARYDVNVPS